jgi:hypothetical protein
VKQARVRREEGTVRGWRLSSEVRGNKGCKIQSSGGDNRARERLAGPSTVYHWKPLN